MEGFLKEVALKKVKSFNQKRWGRVTHMQETTDERLCTWLILGVGGRRE